MSSSVVMESERKSNLDGTKGPSCRFCGNVLTHTFVDLGMSPLCESYVKPERLDEMEPFYPLHVRVCEKCFLVQLPEYVAPENIFSDYAYFSSFSDSWLAHAKRYTDMMVERFGIGPQSKVVEIASNDGYLLQYFVQRGVPVLGIEPASNIALVAREKGVPTLNKFFGRVTARDTAAESGKADLLLANNVLAHVPDINDFVGGAKILLAPNGIITMEFQHLMRMMQHNQYDTIYHEHFSYLSFTTVEKIYAHHGLTIFDVEEIPTHGGSLRIFARHTEDTSKPVSPRVGQMKAVEETAGFGQLETYFTFGRRVLESKWKLLTFLIDAKNRGKKVVGYGAPGKGNTLLNFCGIRTDLLDYTVDRSPYKQGLFLPGTHIPIYHPDKILETRPDYLLILPWNIKAEIMKQMAVVRQWGAKFVVPIPEVEVCD